MSKEDPEKRSIELLKDIAKENEWIDVKFSLPNYIYMTINGESRRWYHASAKIRDTEELSLFENEIWHIEVRGAANKYDLIRNNKFNADICINTNGKGNKMPVGDRLAALALSLRNDRRTAMSVPLLAQFLVCKRDYLQEVIVFQEEGIMTEIDMDQMEHFYQMEQHDANGLDIIEDDVDFICENPPFSDFDERYIDQPEIDDQMWKEMQELFEEGQEKENQETFDIENFIDAWERQDDKYHDGKRD
ncbi:MAG: hypothetical protein DWB99_02810 [Candidatus Poseidoniales archaeon]|nr:MAG: hypothetical protein DWB99_02810 [Candidatus Poseidoniales archaeon]|tara:strand:+ start:1743 stop:2483 length:741 start_codon:yes stop_codon:yes gene_type:complete